MTSANSAALFASVDSGAPYAAAAACENLNQDGHSDWYLPSVNELNILQAGVNTIKNFYTSFTHYWSSTELDERFVGPCSSLGVVFPLGLTKMERLG
ncbi:MAG: hypothetical protein J0M15_11745 [Deltaproteobacteria bacterium]|nr:hypothetical protein [Deltaproteobacteria bacterium]